MNCKFKFLFINIISNNVKRECHYSLDRYISVWYFVPLKVQKILLLIMIRSSMTCMLHIFDVFIACHAGFSKVICLNTYMIIILIQVNKNCCISDVKYIVFIFYLDILDAIESMISMLDVLVLK